MKTVALVSGNRLDRGGVEAHLELLIRKGQGQDFRYVIIAPHSDRFRSAVEPLGIPLLSWVPRFPYDLTSTRNLRTHLIQNQVDILHVHDLRSGLVGGLTARLLGIQVLRTVHFPEHWTSWRDDRRSRLRRIYYAWLERLANYALADMVIYVSQKAMETAIRAVASPQRRSRVIANGVDLERFRSNSRSRSEIRKETGTSRDAVVISFVGRLEPQKGVDLLVEAVALTDHEFEVWIIGDGQLGPALRASSQQFGTVSRIRFLGWRDDIIPYLLASDIFVLSSRFEGLSIALIEAMAAGLPCVVSDVGDCGLIVRESGCGLVVQPGSSSELAASLDRLAEDVGLRHRMGLAARNASRNYSGNKTVSSTLDIYRELLSQKR